MSCCKRAGENHRGSYRMRGEFRGEEHVCKMAFDNGCGHMALIRLGLLGEGESAKDQDECFL